MSVKENQLTPTLLIDLNSTDEIARKSSFYRIVGSDYRGMFIAYYGKSHFSSMSYMFTGTFKIEPENGRLMLTKSLDREKKDIYHLKIKAENVIHRRVGRDINALYQHLTSTESHNNHLAFDEALVVVRVEDENDNSPQFDNKEHPIVAAVPLEASFGFKVVKVNV